MVLSLSAKGLTHGEISAHLEEIYDTLVSKETITSGHGLGDRDDDRGAEPAVRAGVPGGVHRRHPRKGTVRVRSPTGRSMGLSAATVGVEIGRAHV